MAHVSLSRGWILGSRGFRENLLQTHALTADSRAWETQGKAAIRLNEWGRAWREGLRRLGRADQDLRHGPLAQPWKVALAVYLKETTQVPNSWLADKFGSPSPVYLSKLVTTMRHHETLHPFLATLR